MVMLKYNPNTGKLLMKDGHLCTTCCYPYRLGQVHVNIYTPPQQYAILFGDTSDFNRSGLAEPGKYWRIWDWVDNAVWHLVVNPDSPGDYGEAHGTITANGSLQVTDPWGLPNPRLLSYYAGVYSNQLYSPWSRYVDVQISSDNSTWP
jgi:hypothetical protein